MAETSVADPPYRWVIVAAGGLIGCVALGAMFSLPVFLVPIAAATGWSRTGISTAMTIGFLVMALSAIGWGILMDRIGPRPVVLIGAALLAFGPRAGEPGAEPAAVSDRLRRR